MVVGDAVVDLCDVVDDAVVVLLDVEDDVVALCDVEVEILDVVVDDVTECIAVVFTPAVDEAEADDPVESDDDDIKPEDDALESEDDVAESDDESEG